MQERSPIPWSSVMTMMMLGLLPAKFFADALEQRIAAKTRLSPSGNFIFIGVTVGMKAVMES